MRVSVIGCGYLGAVQAACLAQLGHEVTGIDVDQRKIDELSAFHAPFFEPGLQDMLQTLQRTGRLSFSTDFSRAHGARVHFICVGTPQGKDVYAADLSYVDAAFHALSPHLSPGDVVVGKSTVPVGSAARLAAWLDDSGGGAVLAWNPEFFREGHAIQDTLQPDRLVYGVPTDEAAGDLATSALDDVYADLLAQGAPRLVVNYATAELAKAAANSFLAAKISFINAMAELCDAAGADVSLLADAIGLDERIGRKFLNAGVGFGGGCLPKDIRALLARAEELGAHRLPALLREVDAINNELREQAVEETRLLCGGSLTGKRLTLLGATFKPNSDDVRDSPALAVAALLHQAGAVVTVTDPEGLGNAARELPQVQVEPDLEKAATGAHALLLLTEWQQYLTMDPHMMAAVTSQPNILDARNALEPVKWRSAGWNYRALGRP